MSNYSIYHDESKCEVSNFLYHGYLYIHNNFRDEILSDLSNIRDEIWKNKRVHFKEFNNDSTKSKLGQQWIDYSLEAMKKGKILYYAFGVDLKNIGNFWDNNKKFEENVYERFFEIGLNSSIGWFSSGNKLSKGFNISEIYYESGNYNKGREDKILNTFFRNYSNASVNLENSPIGLDGCHISSGDINSVGLQLTDLFLGVLRVSYEKNNKKANMMCAEKMKNIIAKFSSQKAYNVNSELYKKFSIMFFPSANNLTKVEFLNKKLTLDRGNFYNERKTVWCKEREANSYEQISMFSI